MQERDWTRGAYIAEMRFGDSFQLGLGLFVSGSDDDEMIDDVGSHCGASEHIVTHLNWAKAGRLEHFTQYGAIFVELGPKIEFR